MALPAANSVFLDWMTCASQTGQRRTRAQENILKDGILRAAWANIPNQAAHLDAIQHVRRSQDAVAADRKRLNKLPKKAKPDATAEGQRLERQVAALDSIIHSLRTLRDNLATLRTAEQNANWPRLGDQVPDVIQTAMQHTIDLLAAANREISQEDGALTQARNRLAQLEATLAGAAERNDAQDGSVGGEETNAGPRDRRSDAEAGASERKRNRSLGPSDQARGSPNSTKRQKSNDEPKSLSQAGVGAEQLPLGAPQLPASQTPTANNTVGQGNEQPQRTRQTELTEQGEAAAAHADFRIVLGQYQRHDTDLDQYVREALAATWDPPLAEDYIMFFIFVLRRQVGGGHPWAEEILPQEHRARDPIRFDWYTLLCKWYTLERNARVQRRSEERIKRFLELRRLVFWFYEKFNSTFGLPEEMTLKVPAAYLATLEREVALLLARENYHEAIKGKEPVHYKPPKNIKEFKSWAENTALKNLRGNWVFAGTLGIGGQGKLDSPATMLIDPANMKQAMPGYGSMWETTTKSLRELL